jgi:hypothetical protein
MPGRRGHRRILPCEVLAKVRNPEAAEEKFILFYFYLAGRNGEIEGHRRKSPGHAIAKSLRVK